MRYLLAPLTVLILTAAGAPPATATPWEDMTPVHCVEDHAPFHCPINNLTAATPAGTVYANWSINNQSSAVPYPVTTSASLTMSVSYAGPAGGASVNATMAVDPLGGLNWTGVTNQTFALSPVGSKVAVFPFTLVEGWPTGDYIFPRLALGADDVWTESRLIFVVGAIASPTVSPTLPAVTPSPTDESTWIPLGPLALAALVVAALLALPRRRP